MIISRHVTRPNRAARTGNRWRSDRTLGELLEVMAGSYELLGEAGEDERELLQKIATKMKISADEVLQTLVAAKAKELGLVDTGRGR
jgi:hypothetical protein